MTTSAPYITATQIRAKKWATNLDDLSDAELADYVTEFEEKAEQYLRAAQTPRTYVETIQLGNRPYQSEGLLLPMRTVDLYWPLLRTLTSITDGGTALDVTQMKPDYRAGVIYYPSGFFHGDTLVITYDHGLDSPPKSILRACYLYVRAVAFRDLSGVSRDVIVQALPDGGYSRYSTPDWSAGRATGYIEVDAALEAQPRFDIPSIA